MVEALIYKFFQAWLIALVALIIGRYIGQPAAAFPSGLGSKLLVYLQVWAVTFIAQLAFGYFGYLVELKPENQTSFADFLLPLIAATYFARQTLLRRATKSAA